MNVAQVRIARSSSTGLAPKNNKLRYTYADTRAINIKVDARIWLAYENHCTFEQKLYLWITSQRLDYPS